MTIRKPSLSFKLALTTIAVIIVGAFYALQIIPHRQYSNADFGIETYYSPNDQDQDGVDDQTDILQNVRTYLATKPKYKSTYYTNGYPDDGYGVCTDVVAFGFRGAGYDLMELLAQDVKAHPEVYKIETPDSRIDFRRVKNLQTYFEQNAVKLTTNLQDKAAWQGGDVVIFPDHIGIVSDKRNWYGTPFLIHHYSPLQVTYEEDVLENYRIIGHYRMS